ncbi:MAG: nucleotidyltransferase domain-containing protein [Leptolyngbyaceae cyanobacterium SL_5_14]|nr:nucleotidyltransferase domain-containing protein [Leptolyngbyaceae cyanobacterium SL_5_14]
MFISDNVKLSHVMQDLRHALTKLYGDRLVKLILFGSHARHEATADSDIDVMVVLEGNISPGDEILRMGAVKTELNLKLAKTSGNCFIICTKLCCKHNTVLL